MSKYLTGLLMPRNIGWCVVVVPHSVRLKFTPMFDVPAALLSMLSR